MKIPRRVVETVEAAILNVHVKVCDSGHYTLVDRDGKTIAERENYVPSFFPDEHHGDYLILDINLETGQIMNWKKPDPEEVARAFSMLQEDE